MVETLVPELGFPLGLSIHEGLSVHELFLLFEGCRKQPGHGAAFPGSEVFLEVQWKLWILPLPIKAVFGLWCIQFRNQNSNNWGLHSRLVVSASRLMDLAPLLGPWTLLPYLVPVPSPEVSP